MKSKQQHWVSVLKRIIGIVKLLAGENMAFRGTSDILYERNNGNFLKLVEFLAEYDDIMAKHLKRIKDKDTHIHYLGKMVQNEIITILGSKIRDVILNNIENQNIFLLFWMAHQIYHITNR